MLKILRHQARDLATRNTSIIITGATGWLGRALLEMLQPIFGDRLHAFASRDQTIPLRSGKTLNCQALAALKNLEIPEPLIFHCAFLTREHAALQPLETYIARNREISATMQNFIARNGASGIFIPSSGAVYSADGTLEADISKNPYGFLKHEDETIFAGLNAPSAIIRIFNLSGPFINKTASYALGSIIENTLTGGPIRLTADRPIIRSYAYIEDVLNLAIGSLLSGDAVPPFDTAGEIEIEIGALAQRVLTLAGKPEIEILRPPPSGAPPNRYVGSSKAYPAQAAKFGLTLHSLDDQILKTIEYLIVNR